MSDTTKDLTMDDFFIWDEERGKVIINKDKALMMEFPAVKELLRRKQGISKAEENPFGTLVYYFIFKDPKSFAVALPTAERRKIALKMAGFPPMHQFNARQRKAMDELEAFRRKTNPSLYALATAIRAFHKIGSTIDRLIDQMDVASQQADAVLEGGIDNVEAASAMNVLNESLITNTARIMKFIQDMPKTQSGIDTLTQMVMKEAAENAEKRGQKRKGRREDPR